MGQIALVSASLSEKNDFLVNFGVPENYMGDFSVLGIVVDDYQGAVELLGKHGFSIRNVGSGSLIELNNPTSVFGILSLFGDKRIKFNYLDIATQFYQA